MTVTIIEISDTATWQASEGEPAHPGNPDAWLAWPATVEDEDAQQHTLLLAHTEGDLAPTHEDVEAHIEGLGEDHPLHGARLAYEITKRAFLDRFETGEIRDVRDADSGIGEWTDGQRRAAGAALTYIENVLTVDLTDPRTVELVEGLGQAGLLSGEGRVDEILSTE